jgi:hypothetical protein
MKQIKFAEHLVALVLSGQKTSTWRMFDDKNLQIGDELSCVDRGTGKEFAKVVITDIREKKFKDIKDSDFVGHERFESLEKMTESYRGYYGDKFTSEAMVKMITFKLLEK